MSTYDYSVLRAKIERISQEGRTGFSECLRYIEEIADDIEQEIIEAGLQLPQTLLPRASGDTSTSII